MIEEGSWMVVLLSGVMGAAGTLATSVMQTKLLQKAAQKDKGKEELKDAHIKFLSTAVRCLHAMALAQRMERNGVPPSASIDEMKGWYGLRDDTGELLTAIVLMDHDPVARKLASQVFDFVRKPFTGTEEELFDSFRSTRVQLLDHLRDRYGV